MSGITGIFRRDGKDVDPVDIKKMNDKIAHRGPNGSRVWCEGPVALGHQMLHTTPESLHETLPFEDEESGLVITADARIDNRKDLAPRLGIEDNEYVSDSYFILKAYEKWGEKCPEELLGDFAFAIWDKKKEQLFCTRDHMGVKPFYYYLSKNGFFFATEIKAIISISEVPIKLNKVKMADSLIFLFNDKRITFYDNIFRLPPAEIFFINFDDYSSIKYWKLDINKEIHMDSDEEYAKSFLEIFKSAVDCRIRSAFPLGSFLSGGLDSSSIVCTAKKILAEKGDIPFHTFSATFDDRPECDEQYYINKVLKNRGIIPYFIKADKLSPLSEIDKVLWHLEEPFSTVNLYMHWHIHQKASNKGIRVLLDGFDGDTTLSHGEKFLIDYFKSFQWNKGLKEFWIHSERVKANATKKQFIFSFFLPFIPLPLIDLLKSFPYFPKGLSGNYDLVNKKLANETNVKRRLDNYQTQLRTASRSSKSFHHFKLNSGLEYPLELMDKIAGAASIEPRYPFFDLRLIEFCLALPLEQKISNGWTRIVLRRAMETILPPEIQWRSDKGKIGSNFRKNFILYEKDLIENILFTQSYLIKDFVNMNYLYDIYNKYISNKNTSVSSLFGVVTTGEWIKKFNQIDSDK